MYDDAEGSSLATHGGEGFEMWPKYIFFGKKERQVSLAKWLPAFVLGPIVPACYCVLVVTIGQITFSANLCRAGIPIINPTFCEDKACQPLAGALYLQIAGAYIFLFAFSWVFFGFNVSFTLENKKAGKKRVYTPFSPFTTLLALLKCYAPIYLINLGFSLFLLVESVLATSCMAPGLQLVSLLVWVFFIIGTGIMFIYLF